MGNLRENGILKSERVYKILSKIDRKNFVAVNQQMRAYQDCPLPIGWNTTISAPHMHAHTLEVLRDFARIGGKALDVGFDLIKFVNEQYIKEKKNNFNLL